MSFLTAQGQPMDADKFALAIALIIIFVAAAFALGICFRRLTEAGHKVLPDSGIGPIGFVHFRS